MWEQKGKERPKRKLIFIKSVKKEVGTHVCLVGASREKNEIGFLKRPIPKEWHLYVLLHLLSKTVLFEVTYSRTRTTFSDHFDKSGNAEFGYVISYEERVGKLFLSGETSQTQAPTNFLYSYKWYAWSTTLLLQRVGELDMGTKTMKKKR